MTDTKEKIDNIIAEIRNYSNACNDGYHTDYGVVRADMCKYADRLDRARMKMEIEIANLRKENAKLRDALTKVKEWMEHRIATRGFEPSATFPTMLEDVVLPALAAASSQTTLEVNRSGEVARAQET